MLFNREEKKKKKGAQQMWPLYACLLDQEARR